MPYPHTGLHTELNHLRILKLFPCTSLIKSCLVGPITVPIAQTERMRQSLSYPWMLFSDHCCIVTNAGCIPKWYQAQGGEWSRTSIVHKMLSQGWTASWAFPVWTQVSRKTPGVFPLVSASRKGQEDIHMFKVHSLQEKAASANRGHGTVMKLIRVSGPCYTLRCVLSTLSTPAYPILWLLWLMHCRLRVQNALKSNPSEHQWDAASGKPHTWQYGACWGPTEALGKCWANRLSSNNAASSREQRWPRSWALSSHHLAHKPGWFGEWGTLNCCTPIPCTPRYMHTHVYMCIHTGVYMCNTQEYICTDIGIYVHIEVCIMRI